MNQAFRCGCPRTLSNTLYEYGYARCKTHKYASNRRSQARRRARFVAEHGRYDAIPDAA